MAPSDECPNPFTHGQAVATHLVPTAVVVQVEPANATLAAALLTSHGYRIQAHAGTVEEAIAALAATPRAGAGGHHPRLPGRAPPHIALLDAQLLRPPARDHGGVLGAELESVPRPDSNSDPDSDPDSDPERWRPIVSHFPDEPLPQRLIGLPKPLRPERLTEALRAAGALGAMDASRRARLGATLTPEALRRFWTSVDAELDQYQQRIAAGTFEALARPAQRDLVHTMRGTALNIGAVGLVWRCAAFTALLTDADGRAGPESAALLRAGVHAELEATRGHLRPHGIETTSQPIGRV